MQKKPLLGSQVATLGDAQEKSPKTEPASLGNSLLDYFQSERGMCAQLAVLLVKE